MMQMIREPAVAGMFYPSEPERLRDEISILLDITKTEKNYDGLTGIISPHAGYVYSGKTAAYAFNAAAKHNYDTVIIISPSHREYFLGSSIFNGEAYKTPLGNVPVNKEMREKILENAKTIFPGEHGHKREHAVEVQIPFLQVAFKDFSIVPIVMGDQERGTINELAEKISAAADGKTLIIASSDLSHFYSKEEADKLDSIIEKHVSQFEYEELLEDLAHKNCEACGGGPIVTMLKANKLMNKEKVEVLARSDSGDVSGDNSEVVGYLSAVVYG